MSKTTETTVVKRWSNEKLIDWLLDSDLAYHDPEPAKEIARRLTKPPGAKDVVDPAQESGWMGRPHD